MKGIETINAVTMTWTMDGGSDHCPAMKGIETRGDFNATGQATQEATTAPQ